MRGVGRGNTVSRSAIGTVVGVAVTLPALVVTGKRVAVGGVVAGGSGVVVGATVGVSVAAGNGVSVAVAVLVEIAGVEVATCDSASVIVISDSSDCGITACSVDGVATQATSNGIAIKSRSKRLMCRDERIIQWCCMKTSIQTVIVQRDEDS